MRVKRVALTVLGVYVALVATVVHRHTVLIGQLQLPWGLLLGLLAAYSVAVSAEGWLRGGALFFAFGWVLGLTLPMLVPGDSYLLAEDWLGFGFMFVSLAVLALAVIRVANAD